MYICVSLGYEYVYVFSYWCARKGILEMFDFPSLMGRVRCEKEEGKGGDV